MNLNSSPGEGGASFVSQRDMFLKSFLLRNLSTVIRTGILSK